MPVLKQNDFRLALQFTLKWEGGYVYDKDDPGGETKYGISKRYHPDLDISNLTPEQALDIYADEYWLPAGCDTITFPFNAAVFDTAVNLGLNYVKTALQQALDIEAFLQLRKQHYYDLVNRNPVKKKYLKGWLARVDDLRKFVEIETTPDTPSELPKWGSLG